MTKVADAAAADGSTDWFKIKEIGPSFSGGQAKWDMSSKFPTPTHTYRIISANCE